MSKSLKIKCVYSSIKNAHRIYWMKFDTDLKGDNKFGFEISENYVQDIDTEGDWKLAELKYKSLK
ncbi:MAG: hypothetical protein K9H26_16435 [Prolixibacteraceae bacterium]|nr:hypothetical protein [Prolixibacteraceae bacterium]